MTALFLAVLAASLLGSAHCAGMCGAFVAFAVGVGDDASVTRPSRLALVTAYNLGRLVTYAVMGAFAGALGAVLDLGGETLLGVQRAAAILAGILMVGFGLVAILRHYGVRTGRVPVPGFLVRAASAGHRRVFGFTPLARAAAVGLLTTLLPCGWLYAFVITSTGTGDPALGALTMTAFWLGTLPMMSAIGLGVGFIAGPLKKHLPLVTSLALVGVGVWQVGGRALMPAIDTAGLHRPTSMADAAQTAGQTPPPCPLCEP